jgi:hypothetical protein
MTIGKRVGRHSPRHGWNPEADIQWQYRKTLPQPLRDQYDAIASFFDRQRIAIAWKRTQENSQP